MNLGGFEANNDPAGFAARLLADDPIQWSDTHRGWLVLGHREVADAFRDTRLSADRITSLERLARERPDTFALTVELLSGWMVFRDPPVHTRLRDPVRRAITPRTVDRLADRIAATADELLDGVEPGRPWDLKAELASPLPALIIADLLGVPGSERHRFQAWSDDLAQIVFSVEPGAVAVDDLRSATGEFTHFFGELLDHRRRHPGDDLISVMANDASDQLSAMELVGACTLLLFAGHETTTNLLTSSVRLLNDHPDQRDRLVNDPDVAATAADELLRLAGPAKAMVRRVGETHERGGHRFETGQRVYLVILTANRDPSVFRDPGRVDLGRDPNPHLGFGWGLHHCLGAPLARMEAGITLNRLYRRFGDLTLLDPDRPWSGNALGRGFGRMPVTG
ncbi:MAG: cytochrome P450 [Acidimicrobiales bacterium]